jgi:hypothetical protein
MPPRAPKPTCSVCFDKFNLTIRAPTTCPHCGIQICRTCFQTYLLNEITDVPRCVNTECDRGWERNFLDSEMTSTFRLKTYKEHREKVLADREKSKLPATQADAAEVRTVLAMKAAADERYNKAAEESRRIGNELMAAARVQNAIALVISSHGRERYVDPTLSVVAQAEAQKAKPATAVFVKPCPAEDCKGFLSTAWKCGLCDKYTCPDCHDLKGFVREDPAHRCDPDKVATAALLKAEAKSCPKCGVSICKIEGCDQMFCTQCNTGFSWRTGKLAAGPVHNPHYFDWLRSQGRDPTANPLQNGCAADRDIIRALNGPLWRTPIHCYLAEAWRLMLEAEDTARVENQGNDEKMRVMRVKFMLGQLKEEEWQYALQRQEKNVRFAVAKAQVAQVFAGGAREIISQILTDGCDKKKVKQQVEDLVKYCNACYGDIEGQFNRKIHPINVEARMRQPVTAENETAEQAVIRRQAAILAAARETERVARAAVAQQV